jgi:hypothetical protein
LFNIGIILQDREDHDISYILEYLDAHFNKSDSRSISFSADYEGKYLIYVGLANDDASYKKIRREVEEILDRENIKHETISYKTDRYEHGSSQLLQSFLIGIASKTTVEIIKLLLRKSIEYKNKKLLLTSHVSSAALNIINLKKMFVL